MQNIHVAELLQLADEPKIQARTRKVYSVTYVMREIDNTHLNLVKEDEHNSWINGVAGLSNHISMVDTKHIISACTKHHEDRLELTGHW